jgi:hypothetical protein
MFLLLSLDCMGLSTFISLFLHVTVYPQIWIACMPQGTYLNPMGLELTAVQSLDPEAVMTIITPKAGGAFCTFLIMQQCHNQQYKNFAKI